MTQPETALAPERPRWEGRGPVWVCGPRGSARAFYLARWFPAGSAPTLVLTDSPAAARRLAEDLAFFAGAASVAHYPAWDVTPLDAASPPSALVRERIEALWRTLERRTRFLVAPVEAVFKRTLAPEDFRRNAFSLAVGGEIDLDETRHRLIEMGYRSAPLVEDRGEFSVRGGILDLYPPAEELPLRVELLGDEIERIRAFDPLDQRSRQDVERVELLPAREFLLGARTLPRVRERVRERADALDVGREKRQRLIDELEAGILGPGAEWLLPFAFERQGDLFDYLAPDSVVAVDDPLAFETALGREQTRIDAGAEFARMRRFLFPVAAEVFHTEESLRERLGAFRRLHFEAVSIQTSAQEGATLSLPCATHEELRSRLKDLKGDERHLQPLADRVAEWRAAGARTLLVCHTDSQGERLRELLEDYHLHPARVDAGAWSPESLAALPPLGLALGPLNDGFHLSNLGLAVVAEEEIFGHRVRPRKQRRARDFIASIGDIHAGDCVVHIDYGVGRYLGLARKTIGAEEADFLTLEYAGGDRVFVPVQKINLVQRYVGAEEGEPKLTRLGGTTWDKAKRKAKEAVEEMAEELIRLYAKRRTASRTAFGAPDHYFREFEASFAYEETPDQASAIDDVLADLQKDQPMDRLVCGDVGYGKTEVALRAAFRVASEGKQVAVLVPTTVLCEQHYNTFKERMGPYALRVAELSRFVDAREQKRVIEGIGAGQVDIVIGTHRLLSKDVKWRRLGLLVIDEEHRFGVAQKERIKELRTEVDVLTMTATPIPRTLHMALSGVRELSTINTPPPDRLAVRTRVIRFEEGLIRDAILKELQRGGQVFYVHNRVENIEEQADFIRKIVPEARVGVGHGQMTEHMLEKVMTGFLTRKFDVLVSTAIIESGLDIPSANTILVNHADKFGLAQLYQLRGRVGRSSEQAYALFIVHEPEKLPPDAKQRLRVLQEFTELSSGFKVATYDLEIRGAGNMLGKSQSGHISAVGFDLYTELLEQAIQETKGEAPAPTVEPELHVGERAYIPEDYIPDMNQRLLFYKRLSAIESEEEAVQIRDEMVDRFGPPPEIVERLVGVMRLRMVLKALLIETLTYDRAAIVLGFHAETPVGPEAVIDLIRSDPRKYAMSKDFKLTVRAPDLSWDALAKEVRAVARLLQPKEKPAVKRRPAGDG